MGEKEEGNKEEIDFGKRFGGRNREKRRGRNYSGYDSHQQARQSFRGGNPDVYMCVSPQVM